MRRVAIFAVLGVFMIQGVAAAAEPVWMRLLRDQLQQEQQCDLKTVSDIVRQKQPKAVLMARVACLDGREFDIERTRPHQNFKIRACAISAC